MTTQTQTGSQHSRPLLSIKAWCYVLSIVVAINALYVLSWPFVMRFTSTITHQTETVVDPRTGKSLTAMTVMQTYHPMAELAYSPLLSAEDAHLPLVSAVLTWYDEIAQEIAWNWF